MVDYSEEISDKNAEKIKKSFDVEDFLNVFLAAADINTIANQKEDVKGDVTMEDILKNPRFNDAYNMMEDKLSSDQKNDIMMQARNKVTRVVSPKKNEKDNKENDDTDLKRKRSDDNDKSPDFDLDGKNKKDKAGPGKDKPGKTKKNFWQKLKSRFGKKAEQKAAQSAEKGLGKTLEKTAGKAAGKTAGKIAGKAAGKTLLKKIPGVSLAAGAYFAWQRAQEGDYLGAAGELASGAASCIPGVGTAVSCGLDAALVTRDIVSPHEGKKENVSAGNKTEQASKMRAPRKKISKNVYNMFQAKRGILQTAAHSPVRQTRVNQNMLNAFRGRDGMV